MVEVRWGFHWTFALNLKLKLAFNVRWHFRWHRFTDEHLCISLVFFSLNLVYVNVRTTLAHVVVQVGSSDYGLLGRQVKNSLLRLDPILKFLNNTARLTGMSHHYFATIFSVLVDIDLCSNCTRVWKACLEVNCKGTEATDSKAAEKDRASYQ